MKHSKTENHIKPYIAKTEWWDISQNDPGTAQEANKGILLGSTPVSESRTIEPKMLLTICVNVSYILLSCNFSFNFQYSSKDKKVPSKIQKMLIMPSHVFGQT